MYDDYDEIRKRAEERVKKREKAKEDMQGFFLIAGLAWVGWLIALITGVGGDNISRLIIPLTIITVIWGGLPLGHGMTMCTR